MSKVSFRFSKITHIRSLYLHKYIFILHYISTSFFTLLPHPQILVHSLMENFIDHLRTNTYTKEETRSSYFAFWEDSLCDGLKRLANHSLIPLYLFDTSKWVHSKETWKTGQIHLGSFSFELGRESVAKPVKHLTLVGKY